MARFTYGDLIKVVHDKNTKSIIGDIDNKFLNSQTAESLYYSLPLIERLVLEIYKLIPGADVEHYEQGIMKTVLSIIEYNPEIKIIPEKTIDIIKKYYDGDCLRNNLFHLHQNQIDIKVSFDELNFIVVELLSILKKQIENNQNYNFEKIEYL